MKPQVHLFMVAWLTLGFSIFAAQQRDRPFDADWRFSKGDAQGAEAAGFDDSQWRKLDLPHDWSIEDLTPGNGSVGPFNPDQSENHDKTGYVVGGTGWYRKHFTLDEPGRKVTVRFDGVYMNSDVWINGQPLGNHPYGYTSFEYDLTPYLKSGDNVLAVRVRNEGRNSRWYSGSGIYRHVWLTVTDPVHVPTWGLYVTTPEVSAQAATVRVSSELMNGGSTPADVTVRARVMSATGNIVDGAETTVRLAASGSGTVVLSIPVRTPMLWSPATPNLYYAQVELVSGGKSVDVVTKRVGIRKIEVDAERGLRINGMAMKLKGGCIHHDDGPLGAAAIDRAEERKIELLKAAGYNAIRTSHGPPSPALLDACDRLGLVVIDEAFDQWNEKKLDDDQDYHLYFKDWAARDIASMVRRDRDHPSVIMWSIGNEIPEQFRAEQTQKFLRDEVLKNDTTRLITQAISTDWGKVIKNWDAMSDPAFTYLDVGGYNYLPQHYEGDHQRHPDRVMVATETYPKDRYDYWSEVEKRPYLIGDFVWTAMDYLGESGLAHTTLSTEKDSFFEHWPWYNAWCGDLDLCGFPKVQGLYRDVVWGRSRLAMAVHAPLPDGVTEKVSWWGFPDLRESWTWPGQEGKTMEVTVYSSCEQVRLLLNGKAVGEEPVSPATKRMAKFNVPYAAGELRAEGLIGGKVMATNYLKTVGPAKWLKLTVDRARIHADRNDLAYVTVEVVDATGARVPDTEMPVKFTVSGAGEIAAVGNGAPNEPESFRGLQARTYDGRCLVILRPTGGTGEIMLKADADGVERGAVKVYVQ